MEDKSIDNNLKDYHEIRANRLTDLKTGFLNKNVASSDLDHIFNSEITETETKPEFLEKFSKEVLEPLKNLGEANNNITQKIKEKIQAFRFDKFFFEESYIFLQIIKKLFINYINNKNIIASEKEQKLLFKKTNSLDIVSKDIDKIFEDINSIQYEENLDKIKNNLLKQINTLFRLTQFLDWWKIKSLEEIFTSPTQNFKFLRQEEILFDFWEWLDSLVNYLNPSDLYTKEEINMVKVFLITEAIEILRLPIAMNNTIAKDKLICFIIKYFNSKILLNILKWKKKFALNHILKFLKEIICNHWDIEARPNIENTPDKKNLFYNILDIIKQRSEPIQEIILYWNFYLHYLELHDTRINPLEQLSKAYLRKWHQSSKLVKYLWLKRIEESVPFDLNPPIKGMIHKHIKNMDIKTLFATLSNLEKQVRNDTNISQNPIRTISKTTLFDPLVKIINPKGGKWPKYSWNITYFLSNMTKIYYKNPEDLKKTTIYITNIFKDIQSGAPISYRSRRNPLLRKKFKSATYTPLQCAIEVLTLYCEKKKENFSNLELEKLIKEECVKNRSVRGQIFFFHSHLVLYPSQQRNIMKKNNSLF